MTRVVRYLSSPVKAWRNRRAQQKLIRTFTGPAEEVRREHWAASLIDPTGFYVRCLHYFHTRLPEPLHEHRRYFSIRGRGFGEDAFHAMWFLLFREFRPTTHLEIGVYRGQTLSLASLLSRTQGAACEFHGISPFSPAGDARSTYRVSA